LRITDKHQGGALLRGGEKELERAAKAFVPVKQGEAFVTHGYNLSAKYVVHAVCPRYIYGNKDEKELLAKAYRSALTVVEGLKMVERIAFVVLGVGIYRWPIELAAQIAIEVLTNKTHHKIFVYVIDEAIKKAYLNALA
jgi:O-acetyl-ADP-ribose deacetylase (regulator of RNase III)